MPLLLTTVDYRNTWKLGALGPRCCCRVRERPEGLSLTRCLALLDPFWMQRHRERERERERARGPRWPCSDDHDVDCPSK